MNLLVYDPIDGRDGMPPFCIPSGKGFQWLDPNVLQGLENVCNLLGTDSKVSSRDNTSRVVCGARPNDLVVGAYGMRWLA